MIKTVHEISDLKKKLRPFALDNQLFLIYHFGSRITNNEFNFRSDYDFAFLLNDNNVELFSSVFFKASLISKMEQLLRISPIDLVILNEAPPILSYEIIKHGLLLYKKTDKTRTDFEEKIIKNYLDFKYYSNQFNLLYLDILKVKGVL